MKYDSVHIYMKKYAQLVWVAYVWVCLHTCVCLRCVLIKSVFPGFHHGDGRQFAVRKMEKHIWIKSLGWMDDGESANWNGAK